MLGIGAILEEAGFSAVRLASKTMTHRAMVTYLAGPVPASRILPGGEVATPRDALQRRTARRTRHGLSALHRFVVQH